MPAPPKYRSQRVKSQSTEAYNKQGLRLKRDGALSEAIALFERALQLDPEDLSAQINLCGAYVDQGESAKAIQRLEKLLASGATSSSLWSTLLMAYNYADVAPERVFEGHKTFGAMLTAEACSIPDDYRRDKSPQRRLRIGYVLPTFQIYPVAHFLEPVLLAHDRSRFRIYCYSNIPLPEQTLRRILGPDDHWRDISALGVDGLATRVRNDEIDILVDLAGHTATRMLPLFARRPAPIQASYLGYPNTTGLTAVDYKITDHFADPSGSTERYYTEQLLRLPNSFLCYRPPSSPPVNPLPAMQNGYITFGSCNNFAKVSGRCFDLWARLLKSIDHSRLVLKARALVDAAVCRRTRAEFAARGISPERLELLPWVPDLTQHLATYHRVDVALDTLPYNGTTTTFEALWMGVPVIGIIGATHHARVGHSILSNLGHDEWIAETPDQFLQLAERLISDLPQLADVRQVLRPQMQHSLLTNGAAFTRNLEAACRDIWLAWCARH